MLDIENETGMVWVEIARACYSTYAAVAEDRHNNSLPNWNELPWEDQIAWECAVRQIESLTNGLPAEAEYWKKFAQRRLNNKKR